MLHSELSSQHYLSMTLISPPHFQTQSVPSPNGKFLVGVSQSNRVVLRSLPDLTVLSSHTCDDEIVSVVWSHDSELFSVSLTSSVVMVYSVLDFRWFSRILTNFGISSIFFHFSKNFILIIFSKLNLKIEIWNLKTETLRILKSPRSVSTAGPGRMLIVTREPDGTDVANVVDLTDAESDFFKVVDRIKIGAEFYDEIEWINGGIRVVNSHNSDRTKKCLLARGLVEPPR